MKLAILGSGNIARFFGTRWVQAGLRPLQLIARNQTTGTALAQPWQVPLSTSLNELLQEVNTVFLAVNDDALPELAAHPALSHKRLLYASGAMRATDLRPNASHTGLACLWPVLSVSGESDPDSRDLPLVITATDADTLDAVMPLARALSDSLFPMNEEQKLRAHLIAVFCNNFTNHLFALAQDYATAQHIPFDLFLPLIRHAADQLEHRPAFDLQTGPALRHDTQTLNKHLDLLNDSPELQQIYDLLTRSIQTLHAAPRSHESKF